MLNNNEIQELIKNLTSDTPNEIQVEAVQKLILIDESQVGLLIQNSTNSCYWRNLIKILSEIGYPKISSIIPKLLEFLQDINWPGSREVAKFFVSLGSPIIPSIKNVLQGDDVYWQYYILTEIVELLPKELIKELENEIDKLSNITDYENALHIDALRILAKNDLGEKSGLLHAYDFLVDRYEYFSEKLSDNEKYFK